MTMISTPPVLAASHGHPYALHFTGLEIFGTNCDSRLEHDALPVWPSSEMPDEVYAAARAFEVSLLISIDTPCIAIATIGARHNPRQPQQPALTRMAPLT